MKSGSAKDINQPLMSIQDYRNKLKSKILTAQKTKDAERYVQAAVKALRDCNIHAYIITRFIERMIIDLESLLQQEQEPAMIEDFNN